MSAPAFAYRAFDRAGVERRGVTVAPSREQAVRQLAAQGLTPVALRPWSRRVRARALPPAELAHFTHQLGAVLSAGVPISEALVTIAGQETSPRSRAMVEDLARRIEAGETIAGAMEAHRDELGDVYVETVRSAELSGNLTPMLEYLGDMLERADEFRRQVWGALMYPACVAVVLLLASLFLVVVVVPRFAESFGQRGLALPPLTQAVLAVGQGAREYWYVCLGALVGGVALLRAAWRRPAWRERAEALLHRVPLVGRVLTAVAVSRAVRVLGLGCASGLSLIEGVALAGRASGRPALARQTEVMTARLRAGERLGEALGAAAYIPPFAARMLRTGEESGQIPRMCAVVARHYEREATTLTQNLSRVIEPALVVLIAAFVLVIALAIFLPMWDMAKVVG